MRNKLAKNSIAVGLVTLIVTAGLSFSAQAAIRRRCSGLGTAPSAEPGLCSTRSLNRARVRRPPTPGAPAGAPADKCDTGLVDAAASRRQRAAKRPPTRTAPRRAARHARRRSTSRSLGTCASTSPTSQPALVNSRSSATVLDAACRRPRRLRSVPRPADHRRSTTRSDRACAGVDGALPVSLTVSAQSRRRATPTATSATGDSRRRGPLILNIGLGPDGRSTCRSTSSTTPNSNSGRRLPHELRSRSRMTSCRASSDTLDRQPEYRRPARRRLDLPARRVVKDRIVADALDRRAGAAAARRRSATRRADRLGHRQRAGRRSRRPVDQPSRSPHCT